jgi:hypothetical protein
MMALATFLALASSLALCWLWFCCCEVWVLLHAGCWNIQSSGLLLWHFLAVVLVLGGVVVEISLMSTIQNPAPPQDLTVSTRQRQWYYSKQQEDHDLERQAFSRQEGEQVLAGGLVAVAVAAAGGKQWQY